MGEGEASKGYRQDGDRATLPNDNRFQHADMHYMLGAHPGGRAVPYTPMHTPFPCGLYLRVVDTCAARLPRVSNLQDGAERRRGLKSTGEYREHAWWGSATRACAVLD